VQAARLLGLKVSTEMPRTVYDLMELYPQGGGIRPSVWYVPMRRAPAQGGFPAQPSPGPCPKERAAARRARAARSASLRRPMLGADSH
jgi:hypothetical protein